MTYQTTIFVPWRERKVMKWFDEESDYTCVGEDTQGKTYKSKVITAKCIEDEIANYEVTE